MTARRFLLLMVSVTWACGGSEPSDPCASLTVTVTPRAPNPVFDWPSACVAALDVAPSDSADAFVWTVLANPGQNSIFSPVTYGIAPKAPP